MDKIMMIDYRSETGDVKRREIDDAEFCVRNGCAHFYSGGFYYHIQLEDVIQVYLV